MILFTGLIVLLYSCGCRKFCCGDEDNILPGINNGGKLHKYEFEYPATQGLPSGQQKGGITFYRGIQNSCNFYSEIGDIEQMKEYLVKTYPQFENIQLQRVTIEADPDEVPPQKESENQKIKKGIEKSLNNPPDVVDTPAGDPNMMKVPTGSINRHRASIELQKIPKS
eukprot:UN34791